jgi:hypothetical protein
VLSSALSPEETPLSSVSSLRKPASVTRGPCAVEDFFLAFFGASRLVGSSSESDADRGGSSGAATLLGIFVGLKWGYARLQGGLCCLPMPPWQLTVPRQHGSTVDIDFCVLVGDPSSGTGSPSLKSE